MRNHSFARSLAKVAGFSFPGIGLSKIVKTTIANAGTAGHGRKLIQIG
jgi:hypothetical protein